MYGKQFLDQVPISRSGMHSTHLRWNGKRFDGTFSVMMGNTRAHYLRLISFKYSLFLDAACSNKKPGLICPLIRVMHMWTIDVGKTFM